MTLSDFQAAAPAGWQPSPRLVPATRYKYLVEGKGCTLGVLFETSTHVHFEWIEEGGEPVPYAAHLRYKAWEKTEFVRLMALGVWQPTCCESVEA